MRALYFVNSLPNFFPQVSAHETCYTTRAHARCPRLQLSAPLQRARSSY